MIRLNVSVLFASATNGRRMMNEIAGALREIAGSIHVFALVFAIVGMLFLCCKGMANK